MNYARELAHDSALATQSSWNVYGRDMRGFGKEDPPFADQPALMGTCRIKLAQQCKLPAQIGRSHVSESLLK